MGYYTWYTLDILEDPDNQEEDFYEALDEKTGLSFDFLRFATPLCLLLLAFHAQPLLYQLTHHLNQVLLI
jgi:hypothetical protein